MQHHYDARLMVRRPSAVVTHLLGVRRWHRHALRPAMVQICVWYPSRRSCAAWRMLGLSRYPARSTVWGICTAGACRTRQHLQHMVYLEFMSGKSEKSKKCHASHAAPAGTAVSHMQTLANH